jgi:hypothetical protein
MRGIMQNRLRCPVHFTFPSSGLPSVGIAREVGKVRGGHFKPDLVSCFEDDGSVAEVDVILIGPAGLDR